MSDKRIEKTKLLIKNAFLELSKTTDIDRITVKAICDHANIGRGTFYYHYLDVPDLIEKMEIAAAKRVEQAILTRYHFDGKNSDLLEDLFLCLRNYPEDAWLLFGPNIKMGQRGLDYLYNSLKEVSLPEWRSKSHVTEEQLEIIFKHTMHSIFHLLKLWNSGEIHMKEMEFRELYSNIISRGIYTYIYN